MNLISRNFFSILKNLNKSFSTSSALRLKEIREKSEGNSLIIEGVTVPSPREPYFIKGEHDGCSICSLGLDVKHTDVLILSQFVRSDGCMLPRRITRLCKAQQKRMSNLVSMAQKAGLMINLTPSWCKKDPKKRYKWKKFNTYFDESTIKTNFRSHEEKELKRFLDKKKQIF